MMDKALSLQKGQKFRSFEELAAFVDPYQLHQRQQFSVHKSKTIKAANVQRNIKEELIYYSLHYVCQRSGTYKAKGKGIRKTTSVKTNCPAFMKIKAAKNENCLELNAFNDEHNHPPINELSKGQSVEVEATTTGGDDVLPTNILGVSKKHDGLRCNLDIANLSIYIASEADSEKRRVDFTNVSGDLTFPVISIADVSSNLRISKANCPTQHPEESPNDSPQKTNNNSHSQEDCVSKLNTESKEWEWDNDLAAISAVVEYLTSDEEKESEAIDPLLTKEKSVDIDITSIRMPPVVRSRGRPKGAVLTAIGLPRKRNSAIEFGQKTEKQKARHMLGLIVPLKIIDNVMRSEYEVTKHDVGGLTPESLSDDAVDAAVDIGLLTPYLAEKALSRVNVILERKRKLGVYTVTLHVTTGSSPLKRP